MNEALDITKSSFVNPTYFLTGVFVLVLMFIALLLYVGAVWDPTKGFKHVNIGVLNLDKGVNLG